MGHGSYGSHKWLCFAAKLQLKQKFADSLHCICCAIQAGPMRQWAADLVIMESTGHMLGRLNAPQEG